jgi:hypothetical protein
MRRFRRGLLAPILATVALLVGAPAALAQEQEFVTFEKAELITPFVVQVSGTVQCEPGDNVFVSVRLRQRRNNSGQGFEFFQCTETNQTFVVDVEGQGAFHPGPATLLGTASRFDADFGEFAEDSDIEAIRIQRGHRGNPHSALR